MRLIAPARTITPQALKTIARTARKRMRTDGGGYRRDHLRAPVQRVEVDQKELRMMGPKTGLLRTLVAAESAKTADFGVPNSVPKWRARRDSNSRPSESKSDALSSRATSAWGAVPAIDEARTRFSAWEAASESASVDDSRVINLSCGLPLSCAPV